MRVRFMMLVLLAAWVLAPSGAAAWNLPPHPPLAACAVGDEPAPRPAERTEVVDDSTGAQLRVTAKPNGAYQVRMTLHDFDFRKDVQPNGDFSLLLSGGQDVVVIVRAGARLRVTRNGRVATVQVGDSDESGLEQAQHVLAGSRAVRQFRNLQGRLGEDTLASIPGLLVDVTDVQIGVLQGDGGVLERRRRPSGGRIVQARFTPQNKCYQEWEFEVNAAWDVLQQCVYDHRWIPMGPDACAIVWTVRVEGAWFKYLACCSFPMKIE